MKAEADKPTEVISPKVKSRRKRSRRGNKKKAKLSKAQETAEDQKEPDEASLSSIVAVPRKQPKQKAQPILDGSDAEPDNSYGVLTDLEFSDNESVDFEEKTVVKKKASQHFKEVFEQRQQTPMKTDPVIMRNPPRGNKSSNQTAPTGTAKKEAKKR